MAGTVWGFRNAWTAGYTPSLAAAVLLVGQPMSAGSDGLTVAAPAWHRFMQAGLDQLQAGDEWYGPPAGVTSEVVDGRTAWFLSGTSAATPVPASPPEVHPGG
jgi:membrane carboxypeptidase/penicillin-binding protein